MQQSTLFAVVLAAGRARRYGTKKQLAVYRGRPLVAHAMRAAEAVCGPRSVLVTGYAASEVHAAAAPLAGFLVHNDRFDDGLGESIARGVAAVRDVADGVLLMLADQPLVDAAHLERLAGYWQAAPATAVASRYAQAVGVPAIFPATDFPALTALSGDTGARALLAGHGSALRTVQCEGAAIDIDRPGDLEALRTDER